MIDIVLNGKRCQLAKVMTIEDFLQENLTDKNQCFALALNKAFLAKTDYAHTLLQEGDNIDIVVPMQGG